MSLEQLKYTGNLLLLPKDDSCNNGTMISVAGLVGLIVVAFFSRNFIQKHLQGLAILWGLGKRGGLVIYTVLFFPGVVLHEMAHFFMAAILGVRTGTINIFPRFDEDEGREHTTALGSVQVAKSDFFRGSLIGAAPFIVGALAIFFIVSGYFFVFQLNEQVSRILWKVDINQPLITMLMLYLLFVIGNTMFSSKEDTRSWPMIVILTLIFGLIGFVSGTLNGAVEFILPFIKMVSETLVGAMAFVVVVDFVFVTLLWVTEKLSEKVLKKRVRYGV